MRKPKREIQLTSYDELLGIGKEEEIIEVPLSELFPFKGHPFQVRDDEKMMETAESIRSRGVLWPGKTETGGWI